MPRRYVPPTQAGCLFLPASEPLCTLSSSSCFRNDSCSDVCLSSLGASHQSVPALVTVSTGLQDSGMEVTSETFSALPQLTHLLLLLQRAADT